MVVHVPVAPQWPSPYPMHRPRPRAGTFRIGRQGLMYGGGGYHYMMRHGDDNPRPQVSRTLLRRVFGYARPYWPRMLVLLAIIIGSIGLGLLTPLVLRDLIDRTLPAGDVRRLNLLAASPDRHSRRQRAVAHLAARAGCVDRLRDHLRSALRPLCPPAAHVAALLYHQQERRAGEPAQQRRGGCTERGHQYAGGRDHQRHLGVGDAGRDAGSGMAADAARDGGAAGIPVAGQTVLESVARDVAEADGAQCAPRRDHERNPQHQRHAAGEAVRAAPRGTGPVRRAGGCGARWQRAPGGGGQPVLHLHGGGHGGGHRGDLPGRRPPGDSGSADHRHGGGVQRLSQPVVRPAALAEQRAGDGGAVAGELRAGIRGARSAGGHRRGGGTPCR